MGQLTNISWCHHTFNPWHGCMKVSDGCTNCYAETMARRWGHSIWGPPKTTPRRLFGDKHWNEPFTWDAESAAAGERHRVFCASMADVFEDHPMLPPVRERLWATIRATPNLDWLLLTKRPENIGAMLPDGYWPNIWLGTSAETQEYADLRIPILAQHHGRAAVLFVSIEPMLGPVDLSRGFDLWCGGCRPGYCKEADAKGGVWRGGAPDHSPCREPLADYVDWVIVGGESGAQHRPFEIEWARQVRDVCRQAGKAFHFKQHGGRTHAEGGCLLDGEEVKEFPTPRELARA